MRDRETPANEQGEALVALPRRPREETARLGKELYERDIRRRVEAGHHGQSSLSGLTQEALVRAAHIGGHAGEAGEWRTVSQVQDTESGRRGRGDGRPGLAGRAGVPAPVASK